VDITTVFESTSIPTRLLVFGVCSAEGELEMTNLYAAADACGQSREQVRSCIRRLVRENILERLSSGRNASYKATPIGLTTITTIHNRLFLAYQQDRENSAWEGTWHLVSFAIPESQRSARNAFRSGVAALGGAAIQGGLYVSANNWSKDINNLATQLDISETVTSASTSDLRIGSVSDPAELARRLWPLDQLAAGYTAFAASAKGVEIMLRRAAKENLKLNEHLFLAGALTMAVQYQQCFADDPLLPKGLLPCPWPGRTARELLAETRHLALELRESSGAPLLFRRFDNEIEEIEGKT